MAKQADNFAQYMKRVWEGQGFPHSEENAVIVAKRHFAKRGDLVDHGEYREEPGDMPGHLWLFRDGSIYVVGEDGTWVKAARRKGGKEFIWNEQHAAK